MTDSESSQISSQSPHAEDSAPAGGGKNRRVFWTLYSLVLIATVGFAAYQGWRFFNGPDAAPSETVKMPSVRRGHGRIGPPAAEPTTGPGEMTRNPLAGVGMTPLNEDPDGLVPPKGAVRRWAFARRTGDEVEMMALYDWIGTSDQAAEYYKKYLDGLGMKFLGQQSRGGSNASTRPKSTRVARPRRVLVFHGPKRHLAVTMRQNPKNDRKVLITLNLVYPES